MPDFFIEVEIDWREQAVFTLLGKLEAGKIPDGYYTDSAGKTRRWHLAELLDHGEWPLDLVGIRQAVSQDWPVSHGGADRGIFVGDPAYARRHSLLAHADIRRIIIAVRGDSCRADRLLSISSR